jgi:hypothetical protein
MSPVAFQVVSDLHLETEASYKSYSLKQTAPNLALLGDIGRTADDGLFVFLERQLRRYWNVFYVMGNHEPAQGTDWAAAKRRMHLFADRMERLRVTSTIGRFVLLDQMRHDVNETLTILGCTLFSRVADAQAAEVASRLVDFRQIRDWTVSDHFDAHASDVRWLNGQVRDIYTNEPHRQIAIFTHYSPTLDARAIDKRYHNSPVMSAFATDLSGEPCWTSPSVCMWAFGHTHFSCDFHDRLGKRVFANQKGYAAAPENTFDARKVVMIGRENY